MTTATRQTITDIVLGKLPEGLFSEAPTVRIDDDEILIVGPVAPAEGESDAERIAAFREETRDARVAVALELEHTFGRHVSWGATSGDSKQVFTSVASPVMTRLRFDERRVLDTLIAGGVARSRSEALSWCVKLVAEKEDAWLGELRDALKKVHEVRGTGPRGEHAQPVSCAQASGRAHLTGSRGLPPNPPLELDEDLCADHLLDLGGQRFDNGSVADVGALTLGAAPRHDLALRAPVLARPSAHGGRLGAVLVLYPIDADW